MDNNRCVKKKLKPWFIGLIILTGIVIAWIVFGMGKKPGENIWNDQLQLSKTKADGSLGSTRSIGPDSYSGIVNLVKPSVIGISLPGAQPFFQFWPSKESEGEVPLTKPVLWPSKEGEGEVPPTGAQFRPQVWQPSASLSCPNCGTVVTPQTQTLRRSIRCPKCGISMFCPAASAQGSTKGGQQQVWVQPSAVQQATPANGKQATVSKEEYLLCPNCNVRLDPKPGIPWSNATCPNCKTQMAHMIKETQTQKSNISNQGFLPANEPVNPWGIQPVIPPPKQVAQTAPNLQNQGVTQQGFLGLGSGIVVSKKGYILTNSHLISGKKNFTVTVFTAQGSRTFPGKIVAEAVDRDLAIIKIEPGTLDLPVIPIGNSDRIRIGDQVLAFGNPFGLSQTVTGGIVSAMRQDVVIKGHQLTNLIQTDAPINQGNSGGPLVNLKGEVIGINTAIYSPGQTHTGLGFAVPINQATEVFAAYMDSFSPQANKAAMQYLEYSKPKGYPARLPGGKQGVGEDMPTWLGINIQILNDIIAEQMNVPVDRGILINEVYRNSPAQDAGIKRGDVIIRVDGKRITDETQIRKLLADKKPGDKVKLGILRGRKRINLKVLLAGGSFNQAGLINKPGDLLEGSEIEAGTADIVSLGLTVDNITPELTFVYGIPEDTKGVLISGVEGISMQGGVKEGDIIKGVNGRNVKDLLSFFKRLKKANLKEGVKLELSRKGAPVEIVLKENPDLVSPGL